MKMHGVESFTINTSTEHNIPTSFEEKMFRNDNPEERSSHFAAKALMFVMFIGPCIIVITEE